MGFDVLQPRRQRFRIGVTSIMEGVSTNHREVLGASFAILIDSSMLGPYFVDIFVFDDTISL